MFDRVGENSVSLLDALTCTKWDKERYDVHVLDETLIGCLGVFVAWVATKVMKLGLARQEGMKCLDFVRSFALS